MIKIDFHLHTVATPSDFSFVFDMNTLKKYVIDARLDAIAITNHNMFDLNQYYQINKEINKKVYPGIEINLEDGHLLLISDECDLEDFAIKCSEVEKLIKTPKDKISVDKFREIYSDLSKYILIPHYDKTPPLSENHIIGLHPYITAGEVSSPKKFIYCIKDTNSLVPVYFSDSRMSENLRTTPVRQTFLACDDVRFSAIKNCLSDKMKVFLSEEEGNKLFKIFDNGQRLSTGLNVVLGERSSGKSYTLNKICEEYPESEGKVKYIKQFSLINRSSEKDAEEFDKTLKTKNSRLSLEYLEQFQVVVNDVINIDLERDTKSISNYVTSLLENARQSERRDSFAKAKLFSEEKFPMPADQKGLKDLINSTRNLISNIEFKSIIEKHISLESLKRLYVELMESYAIKEEEALKSKWLNEIIQDVKDKLKTKTAATLIEEIDLYQIAMNLKRVEKFKAIVELTKSERIIEKQNIQGFEVIAKSDRFKGASDLKKMITIKGGFSAAFEKYDQPYEYLQELKKIEGLPEADFYKFFTKIEYKILNGDGAEVSGGERSEFNLLQEIKDAQKYDILLIDEPESSFDNLFLKKAVNELIRDISKNMPVVLVTHNSTVGASINPDYVLYTKKVRIDGNITYEVYSGSPSSKELKSVDGKNLNTFEITMGCLEAGEKTYNERRTMYENLKN